MNTTDTDVAVAAGDHGGEYADEIVLFVDDEPLLINSLKRHLISEPYRKLFVSSAAEALDTIEHEAVSVIVSDMRMPDMDGPALLRKVRDRWPSIARMVLSGTADISDMAKAINAGEIYRYITKPLDQNNGFRLAVRQAIEYSRLRREQVQLVTDLALRNRELVRWNERVAREMNVATSLQKKLQETTPLLTGRHEVRMLYRPSTSVGGDFFNAMELSDGWLCIFAGDVAGHGVGPAMIATLLKFIVSEVVRKMAYAGPAAVCREVNHRFREQIADAETYATLFLAFCDPIAAEWRCMNCGHPPPFLFNRDGEDLSALLSQGGGVPLGIDVGSANELQYNEKEEVSAPAAPGSLLFLCTDGLLEARRVDSKEECGVEGLRDVVRSVMGERNVFDIPTRVAEVLRHRCYDLTRDDCCVVTVRLTDPADLLLEASVAPQREAVADLAARMERRLQAAGWPDESSSAVRLLIHEYGNNVVEHEHMAGTESINMQARRVGGTCRLLFCHTGSDWDFESRMAESQTRAQDAENGRGLAIIRAIAQHVEVYRRGSETIGYFIVDRDFNVSVEAR